MHPSCFRVVRKILKQDCWSVPPIVHRAKTRPYQRNVMSASMVSPEAMQNYAISMPHIILLIEIYLSIFKCLLRAWLTPQCSKYAGSVLREVACLHPHEWHSYFTCIHYARHLMDRPGFQSRIFAGMSTATDEWRLCAVVLDIRVFRVVVRGGVPRPVLQVVWCVTWSRQSRVV